MAWALNMGCVIRASPHTSLNGNNSLTLGFWSNILRNTWIPIFSMSSSSNIQVCLIRSFPDFSTCVHWEVRQHKSWILSREWLAIYLCILHPILSESWSFIIVDLNKHFVLHWQVIFWQHFLFQKEVLKSKKWELFSEIMYILSQMIPNFKHPVCFTTKEKCVVVLSHNHLSAHDASKNSHQTQKIRLSLFDLSENPKCFKYGYLIAVLLIDDSVTIG